MYGTTKVSCEKLSDEYVLSATAGDCDDGDLSMNPGRTEICDGKDNNCNGELDEGGVCSFAKTISGIDWEVARSMIRSSDGGYVVAGETYSFGAGWADFYVVKLDDLDHQEQNLLLPLADFYVVKLDDNGNVVWKKTIGRSSDDVADSII
jgi:dipeptidyl aminopeptidase/acylaminoacyl peptidase